MKELKSTNTNHKNRDKVFFFLFFFSSFFRRKKREFSSVSGRMPFLVFGTMTLFDKTTPPFIILFTIFRSLFLINRIKLRSFFGSEQIDYFHCLRIMIRFLDNLEDINYLSIDAFIYLLYLFASCFGTCKPSFNWSI